MLVHCHAGQGRTAILIGAYLLFAGIARDDKEAVEQTRAGRIKCFSRKYNARYMKIFMDGLRDVKQIFPRRAAFATGPAGSKMLSLR